MSLAADESLIERLITVADAPDRHVLAEFRELGAERVVDVVLAEIAGRAALFDEPREEVCVQFDLGLDAERLGAVLTVGAGARGIESRWHEDAAVTVRQDLVELVRDVYGAGEPRAATREVAIPHAPSMPSLDPEDEVNRRHAAAIAAARQVIGALARRQDDLSALAVRFGSDKWGDHWYTANYEHYFAPMRQRRVKVLELGVGGYFMADQGGASLRMWKHYFPRGSVYGLDVFDKSPLDEPRLTTIKGEQADAELLHAIGHRHGPFDIVIDDGSHYSSDVIASFTVLFPYVRPGGLYVVEDLASSYWPGWGGSTEDLNNPATSVGFLKTLLDGLHHQEMVRTGEYTPSETERTVTAVHVHHNMAVVEKGLNTEQSAPEWIPRMEDPIAAITTMH
jgi:hypothetical protein